MAIKRGKDTKGAFYKTVNGNKFHYETNNVSSREHAKMLAEQDSEFEDEDVHGGEKGKLLSRRQLKNKAVTMIPVSRKILEGPRKGKIQLVEQPVMNLDQNLDVQTPQYHECLFCGRGLKNNEECNC